MWSVLQAAKTLEGMTKNGFSGLNYSFMTQSRSSRELSLQ